jgi:hypothetical protein
MPWIHGNQYIMYQINQSNPYVINCTMYQIVTFNIYWTMLNQYGHGSMPWQPWHLGWGWVNGTFTGTIHLQVCCNASWRKITYQCSSRFPPPTRWMIYNVCVLSHRHPSLKSSYQTNSHHINPISYHSNPLTKKKTWRLARVLATPRHRTWHRNGRGPQSLTVQGAEAPSCGGKPEEVPGWTAGSPFKHPNLGWFRMVCSEVNPIIHHPNEA